MTEVVLVKTEAGLEGLGEKGARAYDKWRAAVKKMEIGETVQFSWKAPRSPRFHRLFFAMLGNLFDQQEQFADADQIRAWLTVGAGFCDFVPGPKGRMCAIPKSIAWHAMDDVEFQDLVDAVWSFLRTDHAQRFLWQHLPEAHTHDIVEALLAGYE